MWCNCGKCVCRSFGAVVTTGHPVLSVVLTLLLFPFHFLSLSAVSIQNVLKKREKKKQKKEGNHVNNTNGSYVLNDVVHACVCAEERKGPEQGYQRALFAGDIQMETDPPATLWLFLMPLQRRKKKGLPLFSLSDSHKVWDIWWFMGRGRERNGDREGAQWQGGSNMMQTIWRRERRLPAQPALFKLGRKWPYIQHASNLALPSNAHTLSVLRSVTGHWLRSVFVIVICVSLHHRWGHRCRYYRCSYYYNLWGLGANKRARIKEHKEMRETRKKKTGLKNTRRSTREDERSAFSLNTRLWLNLIELRDEDLPRDTTALRQRRMREGKKKDGQIMVLQGPKITGPLLSQFTDNTANIRNKATLARINTLCI